MLSQQTVELETLKAERGSAVIDLEEPSRHRRWWKKLLLVTFGTATLYLKKPVLPPISEYRNLLMRRDPLAEEENNNAEPQRGVEDYVRGRQRRPLAATSEESIGSEVRLLRRLRIWEQGNLRKCPIDFGVGGRATFDPIVKIEPVARVRVADTITIKLLPQRIIKFSRTLPFHFQGMQAHLRYEVPISNLPESWWKPPARMLIRFEHGSNTGFHFYPGGLEFGDHTIPLTSESKTAIRVAAGLVFPREYPMHADSGVQWEVYRLGLKTVW